MNTVWSEEIQGVLTLYLSRKLRFDDVFFPRYEPLFDLDRGRALKILELGCGPGALAGALHRWYPRAEITGIDRDSNFVRFARENEPGITFLEGDVIRELADDMDIRLHEDGTRFVFSYTDIPTFDSGDREWDSMAHIALYRDEKGVNLLHCRHGYRIPQIEVCLGLTNTVPEVTEWLELLNTVE